jgi:nucleoside-diphosphate-sugar epimerase
MKNVLVIGGSYFAGKVFVEEACNRGGCAIFVLNRGRRPLRMACVQEIACDRHDAARLRQVLPAIQWDAIVDFCAYDPADVVTLIENLHHPPRQYICISTATVHQNSLTLPMTEETPVLTGPLPGLHGDYAYKKLLLEEKLGELANAKGFRHVALRPVFVYGKYNYAPRESYFFDLIAKGQRIVLPAAPQALFSMISVWDLASICVSCIEKSEVLSGPYLVASDELICYDRLIEVLEAAAGKQFDVVRRPVRVLESQGIPLPFPLEEMLVYSGERLRTILKYHYTSFAESMTMTYKLFVEKSSNAQ